MLQRHISPSIAVQKEFKIKKSFCSISSERKSVQKMLTNLVGTYKVQVEAG